MKGPTGVFRIMLKHIPAERLHDNSVVFHNYLALVSVSIYFGLVLVFRCIGFVTLILCVCRDFERFNRRSSVRSLSNLITQ